jgi:hypothetical protein
MNLPRQRRHALRVRLIFWLCDSFNIVYILTEGACSGPDCRPESEPTGGNGLTSDSRPIPGGFSPHLFREAA